MRSYKKVKIPRKTIALLKKDARNYLNIKDHINAIPISYPTFRMLNDTGYCRTDVLDKINAHLKNDK